MISHNSSLCKQILNSLKSSEYWNEKTKITSQYISNLKCPVCGKKDAYAYKDRPFSINCNHMNSCGARTKTLELFPLVKNIEKEYSPTKEDPDLPARMYLNMRGLFDSLKGLAYKYWSKTREGCGGAVMFPISGGQNKAWNGRLFNPTGKDKSHNVGKVAGLFWKHPGIEYDPHQEIFVTEGIIDALSLIEMGHQAIALLMAGQNPDKVDLSNFLKPVFAFDNNEAGHKALWKWNAKYKDAPAILPTYGDWNDFLLSGTKDDVKNGFKAKRKEFEFNATLALSNSANEYAYNYAEYYLRPPGLFVFDKCYYHSTLTSAKQPELKTQRVSNFTVNVDHYQLDTTNPDEPVNRYALKIKPKKGRTVSCTVSANDLSSPASLTTMFLQRARVVWKGEKSPALSLAEKITNANAPVVRQLDSTGYDTESECYIFKDFMIDPKGDMFLPDKKNFFKLAGDSYVRPAQYPNIKPYKNVDPKEIWNLIYQAWGNRGATAIAWAVASFFVNQIKARIGFFPFLSLYGDTQTGKTGLTILLNACQCLDNEGLPMRRFNTDKGVIRKIAQRSGLFCALLEGSRGDNKILVDDDGILTLYNVNPLQVRAEKSNDIRTKETPFQSSLMFVQNNEPFTTKAQKERVISVKFDKENLTNKTLESYDKIMDIPITEIAHFFPCLMKHRVMIEDSWYQKWREYKKLLKTIGDARNTENHALVLTFHDLLCDALNIKHDLKVYIQDIGKKKHYECSRRDTSIADHFFEQLGLLSSKARSECSEYDKENGVFYLNLPRALKSMDIENIRTALVDKLHDALKSHPSFIENKKCVRLQNESEKDKNGRAKQKRVWVFNISKM